MPSGCPWPRSLVGRARRCGCRPPTHCSLRLGRARRGPARLPSHRHSDGSRGTRRADGMLRLGKCQGRRCSRRRSARPLPRAGKTRSGRTREGCRRRADQLDPEGSRRDRGGGAADPRRRTCTRRRRAAHTRRSAPREPALSGEALHRYASHVELVGEEPARREAGHRHRRRVELEVRRQGLRRRSGRRIGDVVVVGPRWARTEQQDRDRYCHCLPAQSGPSIRSARSR
jgi:hypothetical protein